MLIVKVRCLQQHLFCGSCQQPEETSHCWCKAIRAWLTTCHHSLSTCDSLCFVIAICMSSQRAVMLYVCALVVPALPEPGAHGCVFVFMSVQHCLQFQHRGGNQETAVDSCAVRKRKRYNGTGEACWYKCFLAQCCQDSAFLLWCRGRSSCNMANLGSPWCADAVTITESYRKKT